MIIINGSVNSKGNIESITESGIITITSSRIEKGQYSIQISGYDCKKEPMVIVTTSDTSSDNSSVAASIHNCSGKGFTVSTQSANGSVSDSGFSFIILTHYDNHCYIITYGILKPEEDSYPTLNELVKVNWGLPISNSEGCGLWINQERTSSIGTFRSDSYFYITNLLGKSTHIKQSDLPKLAKHSIEARYPDKNFSYFSYAAYENSFGYMYPLIAEIVDPTPNDAWDTINFANILRYAYCSKLAYSTSIEDLHIQSTEQDSDLFLKLMTFDNKIEVIDHINFDKLTPNGIAIRVPAVPELDLEEEIIIAFEGTDNWLHTLIDIIWVVDHRGTEIHKLVGNCYNFVQRVLKRYPANESSYVCGYNEPTNGFGEFNVVLTGHSLGGGLACRGAIETGLLARTISAPANAIKFEHGSYMSYKNVINFSVGTDPVPTLTRSDNRFVFKEKLGNPLECHYIDNIIKGILEPLVVNYDQCISNYDLYSKIFVEGDATIGAGMKRQIQHWGKTKPTTIEKREISCSRS
ncbi:hypothetical protein [uncultured Shewanella sp.]|uniref:hypothetical protein n=1 Tax=uncultured Shewanella sp. TaxID=173975 RepID=UPI00261411D0|nr:hypothetical protein [uncultured Shewanella sp.]